MIFGSVGLNTPIGLRALPEGAHAHGGWGDPKMKIKVIFGFSTVENHKIDISLDYLWYTPLAPLGAQGHPCGGMRGSPF